MKKIIFIVIGLAVVVAVVGAVIVMNQPSPNNSNSNTNPNNGDAGDTNTEPDTSNQTDKVTIKDMSFSPERIKVKKGTTVTWTNEDSMGHNVVASDSSSTGGLPMNAPLLNQGETFSFTFNEVGTFAYHCAPHPFMRGAVEVTE